MTSMRFMRILALFAVAAGAFAGVARALDFDDEDPEPVRIEVGWVLNYKIGTHAGCLPHHVVILGGTLPPGLALSQVDDHTALVSGVPTQEGEWNVWLAVKDCENRSAETLFTFDVSHRSYAILTPSLPAAVAGSPYEFKLQAGDHPTRFAEWKITSGSLPAGLSINPNDGVISGTPTATGASTFTVTVIGNGDDGNLRTDSKQFTLNVVTAIAVSSSVRAAEVGIPVRSSLSATGGTPPFTWTATGLPAGVTVSPNGTLAGVPRRPGSFAIAAHLVDAGGATKDANVTLVVKQRLAITAKSLPSAQSGRAYKAKVATRGGVAGFRWSLASGKLPRGLKLGASTGTIAGKAASAGTYRVTVRVRDSLGAASTKKLTLVVR
jgi:putative Ig domain-containing protein